MTNVPAARNVLQIVKYLASQSGPSRASTIARDLKLPRSSTYHLIRVLLEEGFLVHFPEERSYGLTPLVSEIGSSYLRTYKLERLARPLAEKLIARVGPPVVAHVGVLHGTDVVYIVKERGVAAPSLITQVGVRLPAHSTATGRAILSQLSKAQVRALYPSSASLVWEGQSTPPSIRTFKQSLADAKEKGWAMEKEEVTPGLGSVSAATLDHNSHPVAAIGLTFRLQGIEESTWPTLGEAARISADALSMRIRGKI